MRQQPRWRYLFWAAYFVLVGGYDGVIAVRLGGASFLVLMMPGWMHPIIWVEIVLLPPIWVICTGWLAYRVFRPDQREGSNHGPQTQTSLREPHVRDI